MLDDDVTDGDGVRDDVLGWDVRTWSVALDLWDEVLASRTAPLKCLEIGAGPGGPSLLLALHGHTVVCSNLANTEAMARPLHEKYGVTGLIEYRDLDATDLGFENEFDLVVFKSVLGGVGSRQQAAVDQIRRALKPGGLVLFAENIRGTFLHRLARSIAYRIRGTTWWYPTLKQMRGYFGDFTSCEVHSTGVFALFGTNERSRRRLAAVDERFANRITPDAWHYVSFGLATR